MGISIVESLTGDPGTYQTRGYQQTEIGRSACPLDSESANLGLPSDLIIIPWKRVSLSPDLFSLRAGSGRYSRPLAGKPLGAKADRALPSLGGLGVRSGSAFQRRQVNTYWAI